MMCVFLSRKKHKYWYFLLVCVFLLFRKSRYMDNTADFWNRVNALIKEAKKTQNSLSIECGFRERRISSLSASRTYPRTDESVRIARALHTSVEYLVTGEQAAPPDMINRKEALAAVQRAVTDALSKV